MNDNATPLVITAEHRAAAEHALHNLSFARLIGMTLVDLDTDRASISLEMRDDLRQPSGVLHGGVTATLIDTAMAFAVRTRMAIGEPTATVDLTVHYLRPHIEGRLTCTATVVRAGKRLFTVSAEARDDADRLIATGLSTYTRL